MLGCVLVMVIWLFAVRWLFGVALAILLVFEFFCLGCGVCCLVWFVIAGCLCCGYLFWFVDAGFVLLVVIVCGLSRVCLGFVF